jgi:hypothetical protein
VNTHNSSTWETEAGGSRVQGSLGYTARAFLKKQKIENDEKVDLLDVIYTYIFICLKITG